MLFLVPVLRQCAVAAGVTNCPLHGQDVKAKKKGLGTLYLLQGKCRWPGNLLVDFHFFSFHCFPKAGTPGFTTWALKDGSHPSRPLRITHISILGNEIISFWRLPVHLIKTLHRNSWRKLWSRLTNSLPYLCFCNFLWVHVWALVKVLKSSVYLSKSLSCVTLAYTHLQ